MKKIFCLLFFILICLTLTSCDNSMMFEYTTDFKVVYFYGFFDEFIENDYKAKVLYDNNEIDYELNKPKYSLIPGDVLHLTHKGELIAQASYPGKTILDIKNYVNSTYSYTIIVEIDSSRILSDALSSDIIIDGYNFKDQYVIIDQELNFIHLKDFRGEKLYACLVLDENNKPIMNEIAALFSFNPR